MKDYLVYLAGPIRGTTYGECTDWRKRVKDEFGDFARRGRDGKFTALKSTDEYSVRDSDVFSNPFKHIHTLSPLRGKQYLEERTKTGVVGDSYEEFVLSSAKGINARDHWDCSRCDVIFVNFIGSTRVSIGTVMEIAWGFAYRKPVILCMEKGNIHDHSMVRESSSFIVGSLEEGIEVLKAVCGPDSVLNQ